MAVSDGATRATTLEMDDPNEIVTALEAQLAAVGAELAHERQTTQALHEQLRAVGAELAVERQTTQALSAQLAGVGDELMAERSVANALGAQLAGVAGELAAERATAQALTAQLTAVGAELADTRARFRPHVAIARVSPQGVPPESFAALVARQPSRLELSFVDVAAPFSAPVVSFLREWFTIELRCEYVSSPGRHRFGDEELRWHLSWLGRLVPNSGRAFVSNFRIRPADIGPTIRPVSSVTVLCDPVRRIGAEFLAFQADVNRRGGAPAATRALADDVVAFSQALRRNEYFTRVFSGLDLCDEIDDAASARARTALGGMVAGVIEQPESFVDGLLALDAFRGGGPADDPRLALRTRLRTRVERECEPLVPAISTAQRSELERLNASDYDLYRRLAGGRPGDD